MSRQGPVELPRRGDTGVVLLLGLGGFWGLFRGFGVRGVQDCGS